MIPEVHAPCLVENVDNSEENVDNSEAVVVSSEMRPPSMDQVIAFFISRKQPREMAERFYWNYAKKGWVSSKDTPILNWHAAAQSWMAEERARQNRGYGGGLRSVPGSFAYDLRYRLFTPSEVDKAQLWKEVSIVRIEGVSACRSSNGKVLMALNADIEQFGLTRREPKPVGVDWED